MPTQFVQTENYVPVVKPYIEGAYKEYAALQQDLRNTYDENLSHYDALQEARDNMQHLDAKGDNKLYHEAFDKVTEDINNAAKAGDYENQTRLVRKATRDFTTRYKPIAEQVQRKATYEADLDKQVESKNISRNTAEKLKKEASDMYEKQGGLQKTEDGYLGFHGNTAAREVDEGKIVKDLVDGWKANKIATNTGFQKDGKFYLLNAKNTLEEVSEDEIRRK